MSVAEYNRKSVPKSLSCSCRGGGGGEKLECDIRSFCSAVSGYCRDIKDIPDELTHTVQVLPAVGFVLTRDR